MDTVERMREFVLEAAWLTYERTGSYREIAKRLGPPATLKDVHAWLVWCVDLSDEEVQAMAPAARGILAAERAAVAPSTGKLLEAAEALLARPARTRMGQAKPSDR